MQDLQPGQLATIASADNIQTILDAAAKPQIDTLSIKTLQDGQLPVILTPNGYTAKVLTDLQLSALEKHLDQPLRKRGTVRLHDAESFVQYVNQHQQPGITSIWCDADYQDGKVDLLAIFNDNGADATGWRDHVATYTPVKSVEWKRWNEFNRKSLSQSEFALFIEDNQKDIASIEGMPTGSQMLEMAMNLEANQDSRFKSNIRLQSGGVELAFVQKEDDATLAKMKLFERFSIGLPPFFNGASYRLDARLRYRIRDGKLSFWYELLREDKVLEDAARAEITTIGEQTGIKVLQGNPRLSRD